MIDDDEILAGLKAVLITADYDLYKAYEHPEDPEYQDTWDDLVAVFRDGLNKIGS